MPGLYSDVSLSSKVATKTILLATVSYNNTAIGKNADLGTNFYSAHLITL